LAQRQKRWKESPTRELVEAVRTAGVPEDKLSLDLSIARGLDYYTGTGF